MKGCPHPLLPMVRSSSSLWERSTTLPCLETSVNEAWRVKLGYTKLDLSQSLYISFSITLPYLFLRCSLARGLLFPAHMPALMYSEIFN